MAKPILVIRVNHSVVEETIDMHERIREAFDNEYHVFVVGSDSNETIIETHNVDKQPEIDYEELKKLING